ncbi:hypothetical protein [Paenibacillus durus]|uniref:Uncharacterized protein n=1 Tax=Paenibacillus durus ATCC 35681 TaxID=1333534 RepID=A0A0F7FDK8_PAEDU|nr:hypothetical protein [Paenibacillus durus]AKG36532.1 hypothetical protein VK70_19995 [Paenibacillus durus ATCC 35681]
MPLCQGCRGRNWGLIAYGIIISEKTPQVGLDSGPIRRAALAEFMASLAQRQICRAPAEIHRQALDSGPIRWTKASLFLQGG